VKWPVAKLASRPDTSAQAVRRLERRYRLAQLSQARAARKKLLFAVKRSPHPGQNFGRVIG
jgi:hypothetical protein